MAFTLYNPEVHAPHDLVAAIFGAAPGVTIAPGSVRLVYGRLSDPDSGSASGTETSVSFYDGSLPLGIGRGILLSSGDGAPPRSNTVADYSRAFLGSTLTGAAVDAELQAAANAAYAGAGEIHDATILSFAVEVNNPAVRSVRVDLVFGSEEFPEWVDSDFVDIAAVFVNGVNYALFNARPDQPLSIVRRNLEVGNFVPNEPQKLPIEYDGVSAVITVIAPVKQGTNHVKIGVADTGDRILDSGLFVANLSPSGLGGSVMAPVTYLATGGAQTAGAGDKIFLPGENWSGSFVFSKNFAGDKMVLGGKDDWIQAVFDFPTASVLGASFDALNPLSGDNTLGFATPWGEYHLSGVDLLVFPDVAFALDTWKGGDTWQAYALHKLFFGTAPSKTTLSQWVKIANGAPTFVDLAGIWAQTHAAGWSVGEMVSHLYGMIVGTAPTPAIVASLVSELAAMGLVTSAQILAAAAEHFADTAEIVGQPLVLDPGFFF